MTSSGAGMANDWLEKSLAQLGAHITSGSRGWAKYYSDHGSLFVRITNLRRESTRLDLQSIRLVQVDPDDAEARRTGLRQGDILISITADIGIIGLIDEGVPTPAYINQHIARVRLNPQLVDSRYVAFYLASWAPQRRFVGATDQGAKAGMNLTTVASLTTAVPPLAEQEAIADAIDAAVDQVGALERLVAKKRDVKQGMMQELLTGRTRLPGFSDEWRDVKLGEIAKIQTGKRNSQDNVAGGAYPFFVRSATVERINTYSYDCEAILIPGEGGIGSIFHYVNGKFEVHQRVYKISEFSETCGKFVYFYMSQFFGAHALEGSVKATVDSLRLPTFKSFELSLPTRIDEQQAIVSVLTDADTEIDALEQRLESARAVKTGMMQELLTGRTRLPIEEDA